jgi:curli biogenesis system outer membrane secretion channel CsgG
MNIKWISVGAGITLAFSVNMHAQFFSWGSPKTATVSVSQAPQFELMVKRVAFGQPEGSCQTEANELIDRMLLPDFQQNGMDVIERQALRQILAENNFSNSAYSDPATAAKLGQILGPSALIIVSVDTCNSRQIPLFNNQKNIFNGSVVTTYISKTRYSLEGSIRVVNLTTGQILGSHNFQSTQNKSNQSVQGQPEFPSVDEVRDAAMEDVRSQVNSMFFPSLTSVTLPFYADNDCGLKQVYQIYKNGDAAGALRLMDTRLTQCNSDKHNAKTLARAYYDDGLLHCIAQDYTGARSLFNSAMDSNGANAVGNAAGTCQNAQAGAAAVKAYQARWAKVEAPPPLQNLPPAAATASTSAPPAPAATAPAAPLTGAPQESLVQRLKELQSLYKSGLISKQEYDAKRAQLLKSL